MASKFSSEKDGKQTNDVSKESEVAYNDIISLEAPVASEKRDKLKSESAQYTYESLPESIIPERVKLVLHLNRGVPKHFTRKYLHTMVSKHRTENISSVNNIRLTHRKHNKLPTLEAEWKKLSTKKRHRLGLHIVSGAGLKYEAFIPLHTLWLGYMKEITEFKLSSVQQQMKLLSADYHGCALSVVKSKCPSYVGVFGIVIQDTKETFKIITKANVVKTIPKKGSVFSFMLDRYQMTLYGDNFNFRPMDRISKKFKEKPNIDLF